MYSKVQQQAEEQDGDGIWPRLGRCLLVMLFIGAGVLCWSVICMTVLLLVYQYAGWLGCMLNAC